MMVAMECKTLDCHEIAVARVRHVFGDSNLCAAHAAPLQAEEEARAALRRAFEPLVRPVFEGLEIANRYGRLEDPPLEQEVRGGEYAHPDGRGIA